jgi:hypothetical protein
VRNDKRGVRNYERGEEDPQGVACGLNGFGGFLRGFGVRWRGFRCHADAACASESLGDRLYTLATTGRAVRIIAPYMTRGQVAQLRFVEIMDFRLHISDSA